MKKIKGTYDSGVQISGSHSKPNEALNTSLEIITEKQWQVERVQVPQQDEGESCGYRMLSNLSKVIKGRVIQQERANDRNRLYYYLEIARTLKDNQIRRKQRGKRKTRKEGEERGRIEEEQQQQHQKRSKQDNIGNKKRKSTRMKRRKQK